MLENDIKLSKIKKKDFYFRLVRVFVVLIPIFFFIFVLGKFKIEIITIPHTIKYFPKRVINLGLPKTGTSSFKTASEQLLGTNSVSHWTGCKLKPNIYHKKKKLMCGESFFYLNKHNFSIFESFTTNLKIFAQIDYLTYKLFLFPQIFLLEELLSSTINSLFVLTTRNDFDWVKSVTGFNNMRNRFLFHLKKDILKTFDFFYNKNLTENENLFNFKQWHENRVINMINQYNHEIIILNIDNEDEILVNFTNVMNKLTRKEYNISSYFWANAHKDQPKPNG